MTNKMESLLEIYTRDELTSLLEKYSIDYLYDFSSPEEVAISSIREDIEFGNCGIYLDSPDGYVEANQWVDKGQWQEWVVEYGSVVLRVNENHLFETQRGWVMVKDLKSEDRILHETGGYVDVKAHSTDNIIPIVDIQIDHPNHRYYSEGLSSHNTNTGKSAMMCYLAGEWLKQGKNVLYISLEMSEEAVQERIDANLMNIKTDDLNNPNLDQSWFEGKIKELKSKTLGKLIVKEYPTASAHAGHFKNLLRELQQKKKFKPDIVFIDYINICASSRYKSMSGVNSYSYIKAIAEELRGLACEFNLPIMTATQVNREGANSQSPDMTATSDSFGLPMSLDWFCAIVTNDELMEMGRQVLILLKTRYGNKQGKKSQIVKIDFDYMRYEDILEDDNQNKQIQSVVSVVSSKESVAGKLGSGIPNDINWD